MYQIYYVVACMVCTEDQMKLYFTKEMITELMFKEIVSNAHAMEIGNKLIHDFAIARHNCENYIYH